MFSRLFFGLSFDCRQAQQNGDAIYWMNSLLSKISAVLGIAKDQKPLFEFKNKIMKAYSGYMRTPQAGHNGIRQKRLGKLQDILFYTEAEVDKIANKHMPFLKIKKESDITSF